MKGVRRVLILCSAAGLIASVSAWVGLKIGRPLYYSDGDRELSAFDLRDSGMLRWSAPELEFEIPGPVRGRVTQLPDGRFLYGMARGAEVTDLVVYDPELPDALAQPVLELNSAGHDLAPAIGPAGQVLFASDRPTGSGGFDIYSASYRDGIFFAVRPLSEAINSGLSGKALEGSLKDKVFDKLKGFGSSKD